MVRSVVASGMTALRPRLRARRYHCPLSAGPLAISSESACPASGTKLGAALASGKEATVPDRYFVRSVDGGFQVFDRRSKTSVMFQDRYLTDITKYLKEAEVYARTLNEAYNAVRGALRKPTVEPPATC